MTNNYTSKPAHLKNLSKALPNLLGLPAVIVLIILLFSGNGWGQTTPNGPTNVITSAQTGNWNDPNTWVGNTVPGASDQVIIADGHIVKINATPVTITDLTVGQGTSGMLTFDGTTARAFTVTGNVTIASGGKFAIQPVYYATGDVTSGSNIVTNVSSTAGISIGMTIVGTGIPSATTVSAFDASTITLSANATATNTGVFLMIYPATAAVTNTLTLGGDVTNNGAFDMTLNTTTAVCNTTFNKVGNQNLTGTTPLITRFRGVILNKGGIGNKVLCNINTSVSTSSSTFTSGTWEQTADVLTTSGNLTLGNVNTGLALTGSGGYSNLGASIGVSGGKLVVNTSGLLDLGSGNNSITNSVATGIIEFTAGTVKIYGRLTLTAGTTTINGAVISVDPQKSNSLTTTSNAFEISGTANVTFSSGSVTIVDPIAAPTTGRSVKVGSTTGTVDLTGSTIYIGDGVSTTTGTAGFQISNNTPTLIPYGSFVLQTGGIAGRDVSNSTNLIIGGALTINSGTFNIPVGNQVTVNGTVTNNVGNSALVVKSDATATGSLILNTAGTGAIVERYITAWVDNDHGWHLISSPVASQAIDPAFTDPTPANYDFYKWDEVTNMWLTQKLPENGITSFVPGVGYLVAYQAASTKQFNGTLNVADVTASGLTISGGANSGWNLVGNPFSCALKWNDGTNWTVPGNIAGTAKVWNEPTAAYVDVAANGFIPAMNGFMIQVLSGSPASMTIPVAARAHSSTAWYKTTEGSITLTAYDRTNNTAQQSIIGVNGLATDGYDAAYDSRFLAGYAPQFYSIASGESLSTNTLPDLDNGRVIELGFVKNAASEFSIGLDGENLIPGLVVNLTDKKTGAVTELTGNNEYTFTANDNDDVNRFLLHFGTLGIEDPSSNETYSIYSNTGNIYIASQQLVKADVKVSNLLGQVVMTAKTSGNSLTTIDANALHNGIYMVSVINGSQVVSRKVFISR